MEDNNNNLRLKISKALNGLNKSSRVFDEMINDYNTLYKKYLNIKKIPEQTQRLNSFQVNIKPEDGTIKPDQTELDKDYQILLEKLSNLKAENERKTEEINKNLSQILDLKNKLDIKDKKINGYSAENSALKQQNMALDKKNKELNETNNRNSKLIIELNKYNQKLEIDHRTLIDNSGRMHMEIDKLRAQLLELQEQIINKDNLYNQLMESTKKNQLALSKSLLQPNKNKLNINEINLEHEKNNIPDKLKYKIKLHYNPITSIHYNHFYSSCVTTGKDNMIHICNVNNTNENYDFSDFSDVVTDACFDINEELLFAGSYDKTAKLYSLKNKQLLNTFTGHTNNINCVKSFQNSQLGLTGSSDETIKEWDYNNNKMIREFNYNSECFSLDISDDDNFILSGHLDGCVKFWSTKDENEKIYDVHSDKVIDIKIIKKDLFLTIGKDMTIKLFDMRKEEPVYTIDKKIISDCCESSIALSPDENIFAVGANNGLIYAINLNNGTINFTINNNKGTGSVTALCWKDHKSQIYAGDSNGFLSIWGTD